MENQSFKVWRNIFRYPGMGDFIGGTNGYRHGKEKKSLFFFSMSLNLWIADLPIKEDFKKKTKKKILKIYS